jgi:serine/threonine-protein kinase
MTELIGRVIDGKYRLVRLIGEGGMAQVFEAEHTVLSRRVAVKVLRSILTSTPDATHRFLLEAKTAAKLDHPNVVQVFDVGVEDDGLIFIVMEMLRGSTLSELIDQKGRLPSSRVVPIVLQVLSALNAAHSLGIIHRDLKPDNVFLAVDARMREEVKLLDFGIAKIQGTEDVDTKLTRTGMVMGTPHYLSPEQARGGKDVDARIDIWSVGVMMFEMLSGRIAFDGTSYNEVLGNILMEQPAPLRELVPNIPEEIVAVVEKAMSKDREQRYPTVARMIRDLMPLNERGGYEMSTVVLQALRDTVPPTPVGGVQTQKVQLPAVLSLTPPAGGEGFEEMTTLITAKPWHRRVPIRSWPVLGAFGLVLAMAAFLFFGRSRGPKPEGDTEGARDTAVVARGDTDDVLEIEDQVPEERLLESSASSGQASSPPEEVHIGVEGLPGGAQVYISGVLVRLPLKLPHSTQPVIMKVQARGYEPFERAIVPDKDQSVSVEMAKRSTTPSQTREGAGDPARSSGGRAGSKNTKKGGKVWAQNPFGD